MSVSLKFLSMMKELPTLWYWCLKADYINKGLDTEYFVNENFETVIKLWKEKKDGQRNLEISMVDQLQLLEDRIKFVKIQLKRCKNQKCYRDTLKYYNRLCEERATYKRLKGIKYLYQLLSNCSLQV